MAQVSVFSKSLAMLARGVQRGVRGVSSPGGRVVWVTVWCLCGFDRWWDGVRSPLLSLSSRIWLIGEGRGQGGERAGGLTDEEGDCRRGERRTKGDVLRLLPLHLLLSLTARWPPSWFPAEPDVTWSLSAPGPAPPTDVADSAPPPWRERRQQMPNCRGWQGPEYLGEGGR